MLATYHISLYPYLQGNLLSLQDMALDSKVMYSNKQSRDSATVRLKHLFTEIVLEHNWGSIEKEIDEHHTQRTEYYFLGGKFYLKTIPQT